MAASVSVLSLESRYARYAFLMPLALVASTIIFSILSGVPSPDFKQEQVADQSVDLSFLFVEQDSDLQLRERAKPDEPELIEQPPVEPMLNRPMPKNDLAIEPTPIDIAVPKITLNVNVDMSLNLSGISMEAPDANSVSVDIPFQSNLVATKDIAPQYPSRALRKKIEGSVTAEFVVGADGKVREDSITFVEATLEGVFEKAVARSLRRSKFQRMEIGGTYTPFKARKTYVFQIPK
ncbi:hypothetical protein A3715_36000 [Oleiphilus sp. HI0009]|nr:hypothetical protein A3715_11560 [Oleiphilus sp. HI0009]KZX81206.1 hypothetical protein A3715_36000 [Oleiphilus sp. HI0009]